MTRGEATELRGFLTAISLLAQRSRPDGIPDVVDAISRWICQRSEPEHQELMRRALRPQSK